MYSECKFFKRNDKSELKKPSVLREGFRKLTKPTLKMRDSFEECHPIFQPRSILFQHQYCHSHPHHKK